MIAQIFDKDIFEILTIFSISPGSKFLRKELKEKIRLNNVNLDNAVNILLNSKLIKKEKRFLSLDFDHANPVIKLVSDEYKQLKGLPLDAYFSIVDAVFFLSKFKAVDVYLFGSYAKLVFKENSDIDIAIVSDKLTNIEKGSVNNIMQKSELRHRKKIEIHYFSMDFYKNKRDPLVNDILKNGIKLI